MVRERKVCAVTTSWTELLADALRTSVGNGPTPRSTTESVDRLFERYRVAFDPAFQETYRPSVAAADVVAIESLDSIGSLATRLAMSDSGETRLRVYAQGPPVTLSALLPLLERLGVEVTDERPSEIVRNGEPVVRIYDVGLRVEPPDALGALALASEFQRAFALLWRGEIEADGLNRLVVSSAMTVGQIEIVRALARYLRQIGVRYSPGYVEDAVVRHGAVTRRIVELFVTRFDPDHDGNRALESAGIDSEILEALDGVSSLDDDRILRALLGLVRAAVRTNAFVADRVVLAVKFDPTAIEGLPLPRPHHEIWVCSPRVEGVHLRGGPVARGGIRWSDRREDFRTEVLGLMKAQMVKNAVIVPVGAKGGFVIKRSVAPTELGGEVEACYREFIGALLDLTDNIVGGRVVGPPRVVRYDGDDPYLVVAADKGTATFSDTANALACARSFWLGDAFASGGSSGYDHKAMGITARGAWESVRRHFRSQSLDADTAVITVVGIGDMSGDVFGNGMCLGSGLRLVAAFDHRHVFLDPDPDIERSGTERHRLFDLAGSSWDDYDRSAISPGGGVWPRSAKSIPLSDAVRNRLAIAAAVVTPAELVSAILRAPVDLLWNGGIGTYVKASSESDADVGDRANDAVRVDASELRCKVVGEGGNLGFTQRGRVEFAVAGGLINTDAIDNSAGVDCSDHEVNIKIAIDRAREPLAPPDRLGLLESMTDDVAALVLDDNRDQNLTLAIARAESASYVDVHTRALHLLERHGVIDRVVEALPSAKDLADRQTAGVGLTVPELAVLMAYTKTADVNELLTSDLPDDAALEPELFGYFPPQIRHRFAAEIAEHPLRREIVATRVVNDLVNRMGISFDHRVTEETGAMVADIARAFLAARTIVDLAGHWLAIEDLASSVDAAVQLRLLASVRQLAERSVLWLMRNRRPPLDLTATVAAFRDGFAALAAGSAHRLCGDFADARQRNENELTSSGVPKELAVSASMWPFLHTSFDIVEIAVARGRDSLDVAAVYWLVVEGLGAEWLWDRIGRLPRGNRWQSQARASLRDDLYGELRDLTNDVVRSGDRQSTPATMVEEWLGANRRGVTRVAELFVEVRAGGLFDLTTLSVANRQLRNLAMSTALATRVS